MLVSVDELCREPSPAPERWLLIMLNTDDSMALFAPLHPPPLSPPPSPPSDEDVVLDGLGAAFVKVLVGRGVSVWVAVAVGVSVAVAVAVSVTVGVDVLVVVAVFVAVLVKVGVSDAII